MADQEELIGQFADITGVDRDRAKFHLESAAWNFQLAVANFYEEAEHDVDDGSAANPVEVEEFEEFDEEPQPLNIKKKKVPKTKDSRFGTIGSLRADEDSSSEDEGQAFYAGGSERSGQQVIGPSKKKKNPDAIVTDLFQSARDHGAEELESQAPTASAPSRGGSAFVGTGYRLGETDGPLESVAGPSVRSAARPEVQMTLKMWKSGFSVDNGDLREYSDPVNKDFLDSIRSGSVPHELVRQAKGGEVHLNMEDHRTEDFVRPKASLRAFTGEGNMLGSPTPTVLTTAASGASAVPPPAEPAPAAVQVQVDSSKPTTTLQIRLSDGKRMVTKFNMTHTVGDIRNYILSSNPQYIAATFVLQTTFPNKELTQDAQTIEEAQLANAVIVQRMK